MNIDEIKRKFRSPISDDYPELKGYSRDSIYKGKMGPGGLYLAALMARRLNLSKDSKVLDLGCGQGATSIFLAKQFNVTVFAVDLWISATKLNKTFIDHQLDDRIIALNLDITKKLPFSEEYFDAIFCMDSIHYYGGEIEFWHHILPHLKSEGKLCIGSPCFNEEFTKEALNNLPFEYDDGTELWPREFSKYHSPGWWQSLLEQTDQMLNIESSELKDGIIFWEDDVLYNLENGGDIETAKIDAAQYTFRKDGMPYLTHFIVYGEKSQPNI